LLRASLQCNPFSLYMQPPAFYCFFILLSVLNVHILYTSFSRVGGSHYASQISSLISILKSRLNIST
jgi:hypothetical protein